jgi:predicted nucleic acid-binding protein
MIGLDTGFFIELMNGREEAISLWKSGLDDEVEFVVSSLTLFEIERLGLKGKLKDWEAVLHAIHNASLVAWLDREMLSLGARLSHGLGMPAMDSLILASLVSHGAREIWTTDSHFEVYHSKNVRVRNLRSAR